MNFRRWAPCFLIVAMSMLLVVTTAYAAITGSISGLVKDPSGAVVPGATVTALNTQTGVARDAVTNSSGFYSFPDLPIGTYNLRVTQPGFKAFQQTGLVINANSALTADVALEVGASSQEVVVSADVAQVETESSQMGEVIEGEKITAVPLNGRAFTDLLALQPGVSPYQAVAEGSPSTVSGDLDAGNSSVNGSRETANGFMVNGADVNEGVENATAIIPDLDSISEFRILTNNFDAEYGNFSGGQVNVATKSGTNEFHGSAFEFLRNTDFNARQYFQSSRGPYDQNQFGGTIGGPIRHDKMFFFGDYQGTRLTEGVATGDIPVPSVAEQTGDFSAPSLSSSLTGTVVGPFWAQTLSNELGYSVSAGEPYYTTGCTASTQCVFPNAMIPQSAWAAPAVQLKKYFLAPNVPGTNYYSTTAFNETLRDDKGSIRGDTQTRFGRMSLYYLLDDSNVLNPQDSPSGMMPGFSSVTPLRAQLAVIDDTKVFSASLVNDATISFMRMATIVTQPVGGVGVSLTSQGFVAGGEGIVPSTSYVGVQDIFLNSVSIGITGATGQYDNTYEAQDTLTKILGTHSLKFGAQFHFDRIAERNFPTATNFNFTGEETGVDFADFLIGAPAIFGESSEQFLSNHTKYMGLFGQDSWRMTKSLTLNYGLRWEFSQPWSDAYNEVKTIIPGEQSQVFPGAPLGLVYPGDRGVPSSLAPTRYLNFSPRFGFAYTPGISSGWLGKLVGGPGKTSIRGGFGVYYTSVQDQTLFQEVGGVPYGDYYVGAVPTLFATPYIDRATGNQRPQQFPYTFPPHNVSPRNPDNNVDWAKLEPLEPTAFWHLNKTPYTESYELSVQRGVGNNTVISLSYVGNQGHELLGSLEGNPGNAALCLSLSQTSEVMPGTPTCGPNGENGVYYPITGGVVNGTRGPLGPLYQNVDFTKLTANSNYDSGQFSVRHVSGRASFLVGYTWAKCMTDSSSWGEGINFMNPRLSHALCGFDVPNDVVASYNIALVKRPFRSSTVGNQILGGWNLSGISTFAAGTPVVLSESGDLALIGEANNLNEPNVVGGQLFLNKNPRSGQPYVNPSYFSKEVEGQLGDAKVDFFHGPGLDDYDMALLKSIPFTETKRLELRFEGFDVFNHAEFNNPSGNYAASNFGVVTSARTSRIGQISAKFLF
jgi:hypothetical protein